MERQVAAIMGRERQYVSEEQVRTAKGHKGGASRGRQSFEESMCALQRCTQTGWQGGATRAGDRQSAVRAAHVLRPICLPRLS